MKIKLNQEVRKLICDTLTPVQVYKNLRDYYSNALLLESSEYNNIQNSRSYICLQPIAGISANESAIKIVLPQEELLYPIESCELHVVLREFINSVHIVGDKLPFVTQALFGYISYDAIPLHHPIKFTESQLQHLLHYQLYKYVLVFDHYHNELYVIEHLLDAEQSKLDTLLQQIKYASNREYAFKTIGEVSSNYDDEEFLEKIKIAQQHCFDGDVFQVVLSRQFRQAYKGDDFNLYRALKSINPSPYLFYYDYGDFRLMGSSPEAQIIVKDNKASICPIAGTFLRTGDATDDIALASELKQDPKENAEHVMLVDLARNDLSINSDDVVVEQYKQVEMYSHVIHLVSKVTAQLPNDACSIKMLLDTFPAGTLSGAPKHRAMQIIQELEGKSRGFYGGAIGFIGLDGQLNHAIFIRSVMSNNQTLHFQAGCGVVTKSNPIHELREVYNKTKVINAALKLAETF